jgi:hypothetical protein
MKYKIKQVFIPLSTVYRLITITPLSVLHGHSTCFEMHLKAEKTKNKHLK